MVWNRDDPYVAESKKIVWEVAPFLRGRGLDIGAGDFKVLPHVISIDNMNHAQFGFSVRPDITSEADKLDMFADSSMDFVYSSHTLEHVVDYKGALKEWWRVIKHGGYLVLYLPHKDFYPNVGQEGANPDHKHDFLPKDIIAAMPGGWDLVEKQDRNEDKEYSMLLVFKKTSRKSTESWKNKPTKTACVVRYGAYGDMMQASSVFAGLKDEGFHVTVFASPPGSDVILYDRNIDNLVLFDKDQVPNGDLGNFWGWHAKKYDRFINLSESVEGTFLALPGRIQHAWSPKIRHRMMNVNYLQHQHELADVPHKPQIHFFATEEEKLWAKKTRLRMGAGPVVMYSLSGSSVHKTWAGMDNIIAGVMIEYPTASVVLVGGADGVILEQGWEKEPRVHRTSGKWTMRQTMSFMEHCQVILGPETGVLNAASCMPMRKVVLLSHSSEENLSRDWVNAVSVYSKTTSCPKRPEGIPACHIMHYGWPHCTKDKETSTAQCQADINPEEVWNGVASELSKWQKARGVEPKFVEEIA